MKASVQRVIVASTIAVAAVGLQWISGFPFERTPGEALFAGFTMIAMLLGATCPFIRDTP